MTEFNDQIMTLYAEGLSLREIARKTYSTVGVVAGIVNRSGKANRGGVRRPAVNLVGQRFGGWLVLERAENSDWGCTRWLCQCECGCQNVIPVGNLLRGLSRSCGCSPRARWVDAA